MIEILNESIDFTVDNFVNRDTYHIFLYGTKFNIGGGTITKDEIDIIKEHPEWERISIAGLHQDTFEYFVHTYGQQFKGIYFFKNKMVSDLSSLEKLDKIEVLGYFLNQRADRLWDMSKNKALRYLEISDFSRLHTLDGIEEAKKLSCLVFGNKIWATSKIYSVPELKNSNLNIVDFNSELSYEEIMKFIKCKTIKELNFRSNLCKTEFLAWVCANYTHIQGDSLKPYILFDDGSGFICGKHKPYFDNINNANDRKKVDVAVKKFEKMKSEYMGVEFDTFIASLK